MLFATLGATPAYASHDPVFITALAIDPARPPRVEAQASPGNPGDLDPTFGIGGKVTTDFFGGGDSASALALQPDGKIVAAGSALARYNSDGSLDPSFGSGGKVTTDFFADAALQPDGKIVAAGSTYTTSSPDFALARYNSDGSLDPSFGSGGKVTTDFFGSSDGAHALALQPDGKIVAAGYAATSTFYDFALARYNPDGSLDTSFGGGGKVTTDFFGFIPCGCSGDDSAYAVALQSDGKIVAAGYTAAYLYDEFGQVIDVLTTSPVARYNSDGSLDTTFGSGGQTATGFYSGAHALAFQSDGKIVVAGAAGAFALARLNPDGSPDTGFGGGGTVGGSAYAVALQSDGKIVVAGFAVTYPIYDFAVARYNSDGSLDTSFGSGGKVTTDFFGRDDAAHALALQPDGRIVAAGYGFSPYVGGSDFAMARYLGGSLGDVPTTTLSSMSINPTSVTGGSASTGTVTLSAAAPAGGSVVTLSSTNPALASVPASVTVPAGATSASFAVFTAKCSSGSATIFATYGGVTRSADLAVTLGSADTVKIIQADYFVSRRLLRIGARSTSSTATLDVFVTSTGEFIGTLRNLGDGRFSGQFTWSVNPQTITIQSSSCGSATSAVRSR